MPDSLVLSGFGELVRGSQNPPGSGPWLANPDDGGDVDFGAPAPVVTVSPSLLLDGSIQTGRRSDNATMTMRLVVEGDSATRAALISQLIAIIDDQPGEGYTFTFTPANTTGETGYPVALDCFRGSVSEDIGSRGTNVTALLLSIPRYPFTRTTEPITMSSDSSVVVINSMDASTGITASTGLTVSTSTDCVEGTHAVTSTLGSSTAAPTGGWILAQQTLGSSVNLTGLQIAQLAGVKYTLGTTSLHKGTVGNPADELVLRLTDTASVSHDFPCSDNPQQPYGSSVPVNKYQALAADISTVGTSPINMGAVKKWALVWNPAWTQNDVLFTTAAPAFVFYMDNLAGRNGGYLPTGSGTVQFTGVPGAYRTPVELVTNAATSVQSVVHHHPDPAPGYDPLGYSYSGNRFGSSSIRVASFPGPHLVVVDGLVAGTGPPQPSVTMTVTATQKDYAGNNHTSSVTRSWSGAAITAGQLGTLAVLGVLNLPVLSVPDENSTATFGLTNSVSGGGSPSFTGGRILLFSLADGTTTIIANGQGSSILYVDPASPQGVCGQVYTGPTRSVATHTPHRGSGSIHFAPGFNLVASYTAGGSWGDATATFYPRFLLDRPYIPMLDG